MEIRFRWEFIGDKGPVVRLITITIITIIMNALFHLSRVFRFGGRRNRPYNRSPYKNQYTATVRLNSIPDLDSRVHMSLEQSLRIGV